MGSVKGVGVITAWVAVGTGITFNTAVDCPILMGFSGRMNHIRKEVIHNNMIAMIKVPPITRKFRK